MSFSVSIVTFAAFVGANLPFISDKFLICFSVKNRKKFSFCFFELITYYFVVGVLGFVIENNFGQITQQNWEFFAVTACLFLTFSFPGFVYRYLLKPN
jgi:Protein of unknown function (DUF2818)